jgi:NADH:ubiquinone oxidoreductase subunit D
VMLRCTGLKYDLRTHSNLTYAFYKYLKINSFISIKGDSFDRFLLRLNEMLESLNLITQILWKFLKKKNFHNLFYKFHFKKILKKNKKNSKIFMENIIKHFKYWQDGFIIPSNCIYNAVESPKGEFGVFLIADNTNKPLRCKIKSPAYSHLQFLNYLCKNIMIADLVTLIGTIDIVFGEIDR